MKDPAIILTAGLLHASDAKTAHGLLRESNRFNIVGVIDEVSAGKDAGEVLDGRKRSVPVFSTIEESLQLRPTYCIVGVATPGGIFPPAMISYIKTAIKNGLSVVNGLHDLLVEKQEIAELAERYNVQLIDVRKPKLRHDLHFWTGEIFNVKTPIVAGLGTDCSMGKRTAQRMLVNECRTAGINAESIYTGQTGWLQGGKYGFIFDSTLNDFVPGELEHAILTCVKEANPDVIFLEGQSALRNPTGPCGSEMIISGNAKQVILVHAPKREYFHHNVAWGKIPSLETEIQLIELLGAEVIALALNTAGCSAEEAIAFRDSYSKQFNIPVVLPLKEGFEKVVPFLTTKKSK